MGYSKTRTKPPGGAQPAASITPHTRTSSLAFFGQQPCEAQDWRLSRLKVWPIDLLPPHPPPPPPPPTERLHNTRTQEQTGTFFHTTSFPAYIKRPTTSARARHQALEAR
mmetsp:Transcript_13968/g.40915  ORF Transcript_13968/g.40915 Transcript_13968/m.40915 type:complete len:110 (+) Transcript_13968:1032-1361(+)